SQSTDIQSGFGEQVEKSTYIKGFSNQNPTCKDWKREQIGLSKEVIPIYQKHAIVSIVEGPHEGLFTNEGYTSFYNQTFTVDTATNRMGYHLLSNPNVSLEKDTEIWSDAVPFGGIQIPGSGQPIILTADRQTTGGYPRMGTVLSADLAKIAQLVPHGTVGFKKTTVEEAQTKWKQEEMFLHKLATFRQGI